jgi:hypothetical protein
MTAQRARSYWTALGPDWLIKAAVTLAALALALCAHADTLSICFNYSCAEEAKVYFAAAALNPLEQWLNAAPDDEGERRILALVIGRMYAVSGQQTPIHADRGGNFDDGGLNGRMDCIDHSTNTTRFLQLLELRGWLQHHVVLDPVWRGRLLWAHRAARIRSLQSGEEFVVDSWFFDTGQPAAVFPLRDWLRGARANGK